MASHKIDVHSHYLTPAYVEALKKSGHVPGPDGLPFTPEWTPEEHLAWMEKNNVSKSYLSITGPGTHLIPGDDAFARQVTREANEFAAAVKRRYPAQFGFFASLPLPDIAGALIEIDYALDKLDADGFVFMSNAHGMYLGDARMAPVYARLQARPGGAVVFVHPTTPCSAHAHAHAAHDNDSALTPQRKRDMLPLAETFFVGIMEYFFDTARTFADLLLSGTASTHPAITFIVPHCGAALPSVLDRALLISSPHLRRFQITPQPMQHLTPADVKALFANQFYFDLAGSPFPNLIHGMLRWVGGGRFLYGSDVPFNAWAAAEGQARVLEEELPGLFGEEEIEGIWHGNAERLFAGK
ncbi:hypothetical protein B0H11DRAFT_2065431 [Mycena galericulata]|nr:hypothetical protein B0H11DRAFT_2065431 [Mycena galericulata]